MLKKLRLERFKDLEDGELTLGPFTLLVDAGAPARCGVREALRFLHGIGRGYTLAEILGGARPADMPAWEGLGCAAREGAESFAIEVEGKLSTLGLNWYGDWPARYRIAVEASPGRAPRVLEESLRAGWGEMLMLFEASLEGEGEGDDLAVSLGGLWSHLPPPCAELILPADRPVLAQLAGSRELELRWGGMLQDLDDLFFATRFPDLALEAARQPGAPGQRGAPDREDLASVLQSLWTHRDTRDEFLHWLRASTFTSVTDLRFVQDQHGQLLLVLVEKDGAERFAASAPEGALRFLGALAALLSPEPRLLFFEDIDRGLHPSSLHVLLNRLIRHRAKQDSFQVVATTRSPALLELLHDELLEHAAIIERREDQPSRRITRLVDVPAALRALRTQEHAAS